MDPGEDSAASARGLSDLRSEVQHLQHSHENFLLTQGWVNECVESLVERFNQIIAEFSLLQNSVHQLRSQCQVSVDALHLRVRVLEQALQRVLARVGRNEEVLAVAEASFDHLETRVSTIKGQLQLDALD